MPVLIQNPLTITAVGIFMLAVASCVLEFAYIYAKDTKTMFDISLLETITNLSVFIFILLVFLDFLQEQYIKGFSYIYIAFLAGLLVFGRNTLKCLKRLKNLNKKK